MAAQKAAKAANHAAEMAAIRAAGASHKAELAAVKVAEAEAKLQRLNDLAEQIANAGPYGEGINWLAAKLRREFGVVCGQSRDGYWFINAKSIEAARGRLIAKP